MKIFEEELKVVVDDYTKESTLEGYKVKEVKEHGKKWRVTYTLDKAWACRMFQSVFSNVNPKATVNVSMWEWLRTETNTSVSFTGRILTGYKEEKSIYTFSYMGYDFGLVKQDGVKFAVVAIPCGHYVCTGDNQYEALKEFFVRSVQFHNLPAIISNYEYENLYKYVSPILLTAKAVS